MLNRRNFIFAAASLPFASKLFPLSAKELRAKVAAKISMKFDNGDKLNIFLIETDKIDEYFALNSMNHYSGSLITECDLENVFSTGELYIPSDEKLMVSYKGYDKNHRLVYEAMGNNKTWKSYLNSDVYITYKVVDGIPILSAGNYT